MVLHLVHVLLPEGAFAGEAHGALLALTRRRPRSRVSHLARGEREPERSWPGAAEPRAAGPGGAERGGRFGARDRGRFPCAGSGGRGALSWGCHSPSCRRSSSCAWHRWPQLRGREAEPRDDPASLICIAPRPRPAPPAALHIGTPRLPASLRRFLSRSAAARGPQPGISRPEPPHPLSGPRPGLQEGNERPGATESGRTDGGWGLEAGERKGRGRRIPPRLLQKLVPIHPLSMPLVILHASLGGKGSRCHSFGKACGCTHFHTYAHTYCRGRGGAIFMLNVRLTPPQR